MASWQCEAAAMDFAHFGVVDDVVPTCEEPAEVARGHYNLCRGCAEALELLVGVAQTSAAVEAR